MIATTVLVVPTRARAQTEPAIVVVGPDALAEAISSVDPGTTIELLEGTYAPQRIRSKDDLTIRAQEPGSVLVTADKFDAGNGFTIADSTGITIDGVRIERAKWGMTIVGSRDITITDVHVSDVGQRGIWIHSGSENVMITRSSIRRTGQRDGARRDGTPYSAISEGIYVGDATDIEDGSNNIVIAGNTIAHTGAEAVDVKTGTAGIDVSSNVIFDVTAQMGAISMHPGAQESSPGWARITNNIVSDIHEFDGRGGHGIVVSTTATVDSNVVFGTARHGIVLREIYGDERQVALRNNTVFSTGGHDIREAAHDPPLPPVNRWGNGGAEQLPGFPEGWIDDQVPTTAMWEFLDRRRSSVQADDVGIAFRDAARRELPDEIPVAAVVQEPPAVTPEAQPFEPVRVDPRRGGDQFPVYDTAWQMLVRATPAQADQYFATLADYEFTGTWAAIIHHTPATYLHQHAGGGQVGRLSNGQIILDDGYKRHVRSILDAAARHGRKVGLVAAWQNTYLPGGNSGDDPLSNRVEGTLTTANAYAYGRQIADAFGDHPAVSMWVFGGDAGTNNTEANKAVWREMAKAVRDAGMTQPIGYHTPTAHFGQLNYAGEPWLDFVAPETGHNQGPTQTEAQLRAAVNAFDVPVWQGEPRYFGINFSSWIKPQFQNPGRSEVVADARAAQRAGVGGYVYGDAGRWAWCLFQGNGDASPCDPNNIAASFGQAEREVIATFR